MIARYVSLSILLVLMLLLGITFYRVMVPFLLPLFLAAVVALITQPLYQYFLRKTNQRAALSAGLATAAIVTAAIVPLFVGVIIGALQLFVAAESWLSDQSVQQVITQIKDGEIFEQVTAWGERYFPIFTPEQLKVLTEEQQQTIRVELLQQRAGSMRESVQTGMKSLAVSTLSAGTAMNTVDILGKMTWSLMGLFTFVIALYYFFCEGPALLEYVIELTPVEVNHQRQLIEEFGKAIRAVVSATFLAALAQGLATSGALWLLGFNHFFLFTIVATLAALIPLAGTWLVWMPCAGHLIYTGHWGWALLLTIYGFAFVGTIDNVIRAYVLHSDAKLHPLLAFVSVLGGLQVMGLWGVFIAPIVACCLSALIRIFNEELLVIAKLQKPEGEDEPEISTPAQLEATEKFLEEQTKATPTPP